MAEPKSLKWKTSQSGNSMLSFYGLKAVTFPLRGGRWNYNFLGAPTSPIWGPSFMDERACREGAEVEFHRHLGDRDWKQEWMDKVRAESGPGATSRDEIDAEYFDATYIRLDAEDGHETENAVACPWPARARPMGSEDRQ